MLKAGERAPDFELEDQDGGTVTLDSLLANGELILYFYPADFTPVCTREACAFRDQHEDLANVGVQIVGVSPQSSGSHERFTSSYELPFPLLSDKRKTAVRAYGCDGPFGIGVRRVTYLIDTSKTIVDVAHAEFTVGSHMDLVKQVLSQRQSR